jgi:hypothetical protein
MIYYSWIIWIPHYLNSSTSATLRLALQDRRNGLRTYNGTSNSKWFRVHCSGKMSHRWGFWDEARHERRPRIGSLCKRRGRLGRHVACSFCRSCHHPPASPLDGSKNLCAASILPTHHSQFKVSDKTSMMSCAVQWQSARFRWAHPPVASSPLDKHSSSSIEKRLRAFAHKLFIHKYTIIVFKWLSQLSAVSPAC